MVLLHFFLSFLCSEKRDAGGASLGCFERDSDETVGFTENENDAAWMTAHVVIQVGILIGAHVHKSALFSCLLSSPRSETSPTVLALLKRQAVCVGGR